MKRSTLIDSPYDAQNNAAQRVSAAKKFKVNSLASAVTWAICLSVPPSYASDIEIYKVPEDSVGSTTLMMMLDTSGSMTSNSYNENRLLALKNGLKDALGGTATIPRIEDKVIIGLATFSGNLGYVRIPAKPLGEVTGTIQDGVYTKPRWIRYTQRTVVNGRNVDTVYYNTCTTWDANNYNCLTWTGDRTTQPTGFSTSSPYKNITCTYGNRNDCKQYYEEIPKYRDKTHRDDLLTTVNGLSAGGSTPTSYAYADAAAYLMGTTTSSSSAEQIYFVSNQTNYVNWYKVCAAWSGNTCTSWIPSGNSWYQNYNYPGGYTKGASGNLGLTGNYYTGRSPYSGFESSVAASKNTSTNKYIAPSSITDQLTSSAKRECSGQGIYFLTDGEPNPGGGISTGSTGVGGTSYDLMSKALDTKASTFNCASSPLGNRGSYYNNANNGWSCIGKFAQSLLDPVKNPVGLQIKTVVVGFGSDFTGTGNNDVEDAKTWGTLGGGGWVAGSSSQDVVNSINKFIQELNKDIPSMSTGSSTIPLDALNPTVVQPYSYFPQFEPKVKAEDTQQVWFGNLKKYYVVNNGIYASQSGGDANLVVKNSKLQDLTDIWAKSGVTYPENTAAYIKGGALSQLPLGNATAADGTVSTARKLLTDYSYDGTQAVDSQITQNLNLVRINSTYTTNARTKTDTTYARALMGLLGYNIADSENTNGLNLSTRTADLRQMGSIAHSNPVLLTQQGKAVATRDASTGLVSVGSEDRQDYVLFGNSQGLVQVVDASTGIEKFAFVPKEMIERQSETFKNKGGTLSAGKNALYYGMDGEWTAHTVYVTKTDGTLTTKGTARNVVGSAEDKENLQGKQWVYGGMRMGGRSYYALDLTDIDNPKIKFQIDPTSGKVYSQENPSGVSYAALSKMGQSWSKPTLDYVNWKGQRKLVMLVGGGYDAGGEDGDGLYSNGVRTGYAGYESYNYKQENSTSANKSIGAGVYMFDADNGDLLWTADSSANANLKYSVASEIKTVDRNNDGVVDHLYFGDLAGQAFRVDFKNDGASTFSAQATRILDLHQTDGTSPRFYTTPVFTAHRSAGKTEGGNIVLAIFASGNKSSPLLASTNSPQKKDSSGLQYDGVYAVYDYDVYPQGSNYPSTNLAARTLAASGASASNTKLKYINDAATGALIDKDTGWGGWYYQLNKKFNNTSASASIIKALSNMLALEGNLYVTQYDSSDNGTTSSCGAGVLGNSFATRVCLPTGVCTEDAKYTYNLGSGIVSLNVGGGPGPEERQLVVPDPTNVCVGEGCSPCVGTACKPGKKFIPAGGPLKFIPNRWYEKYAKVG